jgi:hypothetical protein
MADLRVTGVSNNNLELQAPDGSKHTLAISEDLLKALKTREVQLPKSVTPRDIQQLVRLGATVDQVVDQTGADLELVTRFAKPIIAELNHVVNLARNVRLSLAGDRFADNNPIEFGVVMDERLSNNGAKNVSWSACKTNEGEWLVSVSFETSTGEGKATWAFEPKQLFLAPENEAALQLSNGGPVAVQTKSAAQSHPVMSETIPEVVEEKPVTANLTIVPEPVKTYEEPAFFEEEEPIAPVQLRAIPDEPETEAIEVITVTEVVEVVSTTEEEQTDVAEEEVEAPAVKPQASSGWAEVLFGSRDDEEEN